MLLFLETPSMAFFTLLRSRPGAGRGGTCLEAKGTYRQSAREVPTPLPSCPLGPHLCEVAPAVRQQGSVCL